MSRLIQAVSESGSLFPSKAISSGEKSALGPAEARAFTGKQRRSGPFPGPDLLVYFLG